MSTILKEIRAAFGDVEAAPYRVVVQRGGYEERAYPARRWACTAMSGPSRHALVTPMYRRLLSYVSGRNEPNVRMDMTTPFTTLVEPHLKEEERAARKLVVEEEEPSEATDGASKTTADAATTPTTTTTTPAATTCSSPPPTYTMGFLIPDSHQKEPPSTADKKVFIEQRPRMVVLARRFSGYLNDEVVTKELAALRESIKTCGDLEHVDLTRYYVVGYDTPFKLLGRRNEVWLVKNVSEEVLKEENGGGGDDFVIVEKEEGGGVVMVNGGLAEEAVEDGIVTLNGVMGKINGDVVFVKEAN